MDYLHTMIRISDVDVSLDFYCNKLGMVEVNRYESSQGQFTLIFLAAANDAAAAKENKTPLLELTYNWPAEGDSAESLSVGRNFGHLAFRVEDIYSVCQSLIDAGVEINRPPRDGHMAFIKSPDNISIELLQKGDSLEPMEPWLSMANIGEW